MTREGAIAILRRDVTACLHGTIWGGALDMAIEALEQESKWISVSERLPKPYEQVLRTVKSIGWNGTSNIYVDLGTICPIDTDVIAWMPLPKPYEPQESEG